MAEKNPMAETTMYVSNLGVGYELVGIIYTGSYYLGKELALALAWQRQANC